MTDKQHPARKLYKTSHQGCVPRNNAEKESTLVYYIHLFFSSGTIVVEMISLRKVNLFQSILCKYLQF